MSSRLHKPLLLIASVLALLLAGPRAEAAFISTTVPGAGCVRSTWLPCSTDIAEITEFLAIHPGFRCTPWPGNLSMSATNYGFQDDEGDPTAWYLGSSGNWLHNAVYLGIRLLLEAVTSACRTTSDLEGCWIEQANSYLAAILIETEIPGGPPPFWLHTEGFSQHPSRCNRGLFRPPRSPCLRLDNARLDCRDPVPLEC